MMGLLHAYHKFITYDTLFIRKGGGTEGSIERAAGRKEDAFGASRFTCVAGTNPVIRLEDAS